MLPQQPCSRSGVWNAVAPAGHMVLYALATIMELVSSVMNEITSSSRPIPRVLVRFTTETQRAQRGT